MVKRYWPDEGRKMSKRKICKEEKKREEKGRNEENTTLSGEM